MCGITGVLNLDARPYADPGLLEAMTERIAHRGPDAKGYHVDGPVGLGHRRLSIIDLATGQQPMQDERAGRVIVYNGEVYNFQELRRDLEGRGATFRTRCDTEVVLHAADLRDTGWLHALNGMYALAIWFQPERTLLLARDRLGIKPLYYAVVGGQFIFASEIKALLAHPGLAREVRVDALSEFLAFRTLSDDETLLRGIHALPAGHVLRVSPGRPVPAPERFWSDVANSDPPLLGAGTDHVEAGFLERLDDAVRYRLISDVPLGTYNSGGVDSSLVTDAVRRQTQGELHTFSVGFTEESHDESRFAEIVARRVGTHHHALRLTQREFRDSLLDATWSLDEPLNHAHTVALLRLSRLAKEYVTVVLTGEGADELFAGYPRYQIPLLARRLAAWPRLLRRPLLEGMRLSRRRRLAKLASSGADVRLGIMENARFAPREELALVGLPEPAARGREAGYLALEQATLPELEKVLAFDRATYLPSLLQRLDRTTMASGVEARVPFLDYRLLAWSKCLPAGLKVRLAQENKVLLKRVAARRFPRRMIYRRKMGFDVPVAAWLRERDGLRGFLDCLTDDTFRGRGYYREGAVAKLIAEHLSGERDRSAILWPILTLELWHRVFVDAGGRA